MATLKPQYQIIYQSPVDNATWYGVKCSLPVAEWVRVQDKNMFYEHSDSLRLIDMHEELMCLVKLRF